MRVADNGGLPCCCRGVPKHLCAVNLLSCSQNGCVQCSPCMLCSVRRLPGMPSSNALYEAMAGDLDDFGLEAYVGNPAEREVPGADLHSQMEARRAGGPRTGPVPATRAFF
jgi:Proteasome maturation factor UMP1